MLGGVLTCSSCCHLDIYRFVWVHFGFGVVIGPTSICIKPDINVKLSACIVEVTDVILTQLRELAQLVS